MNMILHNLKVAVRNLMKYKLQTVISVLSIAVGIVTLSFTHSLLSRFQLPSIYKESYYDRAYQLEFISKDNGQTVTIDNDIVRTIKKDGGPRCVEKIAVPNVCPVYVKANFIMTDSTIRRGNVDGYIIDPSYADYAGLRSAITGKKIKVLKAGEAIISEDFAKRIFQDKNPIGTVQTRTKINQPIPVTIVDVFKSVSVTDSPMDNDALYYCIADDISDYDLDESFYFTASISVVLKNGYTKNQLIREIEDRIKPLGLSLKVERVSNREDIKMILAIQVIGNIVGSLILLAAIIGFMRIEIQLFRIRRRELSLRIVNGANRLKLFGLIFMEIFVVISLSFIVAIILGILLQNFCDTKLNVIVNNTGFNIHALWLYIMEIGGGLLAFCCIIAWIALTRIFHQGVRLAENMQRSRNHIFRNVMLVIQIVICIVFICCTFILIHRGNKIMEEYNVPDNDSYYKEYLYFEPMYSTEKERLLDEIKHLPNIDKILLCEQSYTSLDEIKESTHAIEKLDRHTYFKTYFTDDPSLISTLGMKVEWFNRKNNTDNEMMLISDKLYRKFQEIGILNNNSLTIELNGDVTFSIVGTIKSIPYDIKNELLVFIRPNWEDYEMMQFILIPKPGKGESLSRSVDETVELIEPELINKVVSNYRERISPVPGFIEAVRDGGIILGCVSLLICAMSIFSTITLDTRARRKEIAVRKVNGAKSRDIYRMFGKVYLVMIGISIFIAVPICILFNRVVKSMFMLVEIASVSTFSPLWPIILGVSVVTVLIISIVCWQIHKTMQVNPAKIIAKE